MLEENVSLKKQEYDKIFNYFHKEYTQLLKNFLQRHEVVIKDGDCLIDYIVKTRMFMPRYSLYTIPITHTMYNEEESEESKYSLLLSSYPIVKEAFNQ